VRCGQVISGIERITSLTLFIDLDAVLSRLSVEERRVMGSVQSLEVFSERRAHLV